MKKTNILKICLIAMLVIAIFPIVSFGADTTITFEDSELASKVANILGSNATLSENTITVSEDVINNVTSLNFQGSNALSNCTSLTGLEKFTNLTSLAIVGGQFTELVPLEDLTKLTNLQILSSKANDINPILNLTDLKTLDITNNNISSIKGIEKLTNLTVLKIGNSNFTSEDTVDVNQINKISDVSGVEKLQNLQYFEAKNMIIYKDVSVGSEETNITADLPQLVVYAKKADSIIYTSQDLQIENANLSTDGTKVTMNVQDLKDGKVKVRVVGSDSNSSAEGTVVNFQYVEAFEVTSITKTPDTETDGKVKVTITVNKELDSTKIPAGWVLGDDKKSVSKEFDKNGNEEVVLTDKSGNTVTQTVEVSNIKEKEFKVVNEQQENTDDGKVKVTITVNKELNPDKIPTGWTLLDDKKSISKIMKDGDKETIKLVSIDGEEIEYTVTAQIFKVVDRKDENQENGKVKVTITVNKELDLSKIPDGWTLLDDGKSIWKVVDKGTTEDIVLVAKDGSVVKYQLTVIDDTKANTNHPQTGVTNIILIVIAGIAIVGVVLFVRTRKMLK